MKEFAPLDAMSPPPVATEPMAKPVTKASHLVNLCDALETIMHVVSGFTMQALFHSSPTGGLNAAGRQISELSDLVCGQYLDAVEALRDAQPGDYATERRRKMRLALMDLDQDDDALELVLRLTERH